MKLPNDDELPPTLAVGEVLEDELDGTPYRADGILARGGMGEVHRATRLSDGARLALKCVRRDLVHNATIRLRTRFEAQAFREIDHPNVVRVYGTGVRADNVPWMAMQWLQGYTLLEIIERKGKIPIRWAIEIVRDLCRGLHPVHKYAIHRDVKPANAHFGYDSVTRVLDLGVARSVEANVHLTTTGTQVGTLPFMAPEQLDNSTSLDLQVDLWAAVVVLYILISGVHPFADVSGSLPPNKIMLGYRILQDPHRPITSVVEGAPPWLDQIVDRGLAKDPDQRHRSAEELARVLTAALNFLEASTGHAEPLSRLIPQLPGTTTPRGVAAPPPRLWMPPRATEPMPPPASETRAPARPWRLHVAWQGPRTTEPMPAPGVAAAPRQDSPAEAAPEPPRRATEQVPTDEHPRVALVPPPSTALASPASANDSAPQDDAHQVRESDVRIKRSSRAEAPKRPPEAPPATRRPPEPVVTASTPAPPTLAASTPAAPPPQPPCAGSLAVGSPAAGAGHCGEPLRRRAGGARQRRRPPGRSLAKGNSTAVEQAPTAREGAPQVAEGRDAGEAGGAPHEEPPRAKAQRRPTMALDRQRLQSAPLDGPLVLRRHAGDDERALLAGVEALDGAAHRTDRCASPCPPRAGCNGGHPRTHGSAGGAARSDLDGDRDPGGAARRPRILGIGTSRTGPGADGGAPDPRAAPAGPGAQAFRQLSAAPAPAPSAAHRMFGTEN